MALYVTYLFFPYTLCKGTKTDTIQALGAVPAVPGYFSAMKAVCEKHGALFILDEVMSGMGRTGTLHAWEQENVVPDMQAIGKGLGGGYAPVSGILIGDKIVQVLDKGTGAFRHGQTYQGHPVSCAAALAVQRVIKEEKLLHNVKAMGEYLGDKLKAELGSHPNVGDIRGRGLFWGVSLSSFLLLSFRVLKTKLTQNGLSRSNSSKTKQQKSHSQKPQPCHSLSKKQG